LVLLDLYSPLVQLVLCFLLVLWDLYYQLAQLALYSQLVQ